jgi:hypothetical protein
MVKPGGSWTRSTSYVCSTLLGLFLLASASVAQITFTDLTASAGFGNVTGCCLSSAWTDYDLDGLLDVAVLCHTQEVSGSLNSLFHNNGDGTFTDVVLAAGMLDFSLDPHGGGWCDYDDDGDADLFVAHGLLLGQSDQNNMLYQNQGDGTFIDTAEASGLHHFETQQLTGVNWIDDDNDGAIDLFIAGKTGISQQLGNLHFRNNGDSTYTEIADQTGLRQLSAESVTSFWQDYDDDGDLDVFICKEGLLFDNNGSQVYVDQTAAAGIAPVGFCRSANWGDYDQDGDADLYISTLAAFDSTLYRNNGDGTFTDVGMAAGVLERVESHSSNWGDFDNDKDLDLLVVTGRNSSDPNRLFQNNGDGTFTEVGTSAGIAGQVLGSGADGSFVDVDDDGNLDIFITNGNSGQPICQDGPLLYFHNDGQSTNNWLKIELDGVQSNPNGLGAKVRVNTADGTQQFVQYFGQQHFMTQDLLPMHFGLGANTEAESIEIEWPSGVVDQLSGVAAGQTITVVEGQTAGPDEVTILRAIWRSANNILIVIANSSSGGDVTLTVEGFGNLQWIPTAGIHRRAFPGVTADPGTVTVTSTGDGSDTADVRAF